MDRSKAKTIPGSRKGAQVFFLEDGLHGGGPDRGLLCGDVVQLSGSVGGRALGRERGGGAAGGQGGRGGAGARGRGGGVGGGRGGGVFVGSSGGGGGLVVHLENVLLEVTDPVLLHRERPVELHLAEPALEGVEVALQLDERVGRGLGHQGRDCACTSANAGGSG